MNVQYQEFRMVGMPLQLAAALEGSIAPHTTPRTPRECVYSLRHEASQLSHL